MQKRQKASDVFQETDFLLGKKSTFEQAFPEIADIRIDIEELKDFFSEGRKRYHSKSSGEYINCSNPVCYNGGVSIGRLIRNMVYREQTELETTETCQGYHGSPKGRKNYGPCEHRFKISIKIKYKEDEPGTKESSGLEQEETGGQVGG